MRPSAAHSRSARRRLNSRCRARIGWASWAASESPAPTGSGSPSRARRRLMASFWWRVTPDSPAFGPAVATRTHLQETEQSVNAGWAHVVHRPSRRRARDRALTASGHDVGARGARIGDNGAMTARRDVILLGSTGSIGTQALDVIARNPGRFRVVGLGAGGGNVALLAEQAVAFDVPVVAVADAAAAPALEAELAALRPAGRLPEVLAGPDAATELAGRPCDVVLNGMTGAVGPRAHPRRPARRAQPGPGQQGVADHRRPAGHRRRRPGPDHPRRLRALRPGPVPRGRACRRGSPARAHRQRGTVPRPHPSRAG